MGETIQGDDGLPAEVVGPWAKSKINYLCRYIDITRRARAKFLPPKGNGGACYIDLFCSTGRSFIRETGEWIDGSPVAAWKKSREGGAPFSTVIVADIDKVRLDACVTRLARAGAPVVGFLGPASETVHETFRRAPSFGLNLAFLDPYNLRSLEFAIIQQLAQLRHIDLLVHISKMDMQRNASIYFDENESAFDRFAPGWRSRVNLQQPRHGARADLFAYWRDLVASTGIAASEDTKLITGPQGQHLYWLLIAAGHHLAHKFWRIACEDEQRSLDL
jgi:three-Cys-motif partner protein